MSGEAKGTAGPSGRAATPAIKIMLLGDAGVGKSSLMLRFCLGQFEENMVSTTGVDFKVKHVDFDGTFVMVQIWDTAGQERFKTITTSYYRGAMGVIFVYDVTSPDTFQNVTYWIKSLSENVEANVKRLLVANKVDLESARRVSRAEGEELARQFGLRYAEASAKDSLNVDRVFLSVAREVFDDKGLFGAAAARAAAAAQPVKLPGAQEQAPEKKGGCC